MDFISIAQAATEVAQEVQTAETSSGGAIGALGLNLKLFIAQLVNFAVVLLVLWKWVFTPVAKKLTERTERIEKSLNDADRIQKEKEDFGKWKDTEMVRVRSQSAAIVAAAEMQAQKSKAEIERQTKENQEKIVQQAKTQIEQEKTKAVSDAKAELADLVTNATEKILREKLDDQKDKSLIKKMIESLK